MQPKGQRPWNALRTRNPHHQTQRHTDALGDSRHFPRHMRGNIRVLFLPVFYRTKAALITDAVWTTTPKPLPFTHGFHFGVSDVVFRYISYTTDRFPSSPPKSCKAHELISERFGRSVRVQGNGPVSTPPYFTPTLLYLTAARSGTNGCSPSIPSLSITF